MSGSLFVWSELGRVVICSQARSTSQEASKGSVDMTNRDGIETGGFPDEIPLKL